MPGLGSSSVGIRKIPRRLLRDLNYYVGIILVLAIGVVPGAAGLSVWEDVIPRPLDCHDPDRLGIIRIDVEDLRSHPGLAETEITELQKVGGMLQAVEWVIFGNDYLDLGSEIIPVSGAGIS